MRSTPSALRKYSDQFPRFGTNINFGSHARVLKRLALFLGKRAVRPLLADFPLLTLTNLSIFQQFALSQNKLLLPHLELGIGKSFSPFLLISCLEFRIVHLGGPIVVTEEATQVDLVQRVSMGFVVFWAGELRADRPEGTFEFEAHAVEVAAYGVVVAPTALERTSKFHAGLLETVLAMAGLQLILQNLEHESLMRKEAFELKLVVGDFDCIARRVPRSKSTRQVTW